MPKKQRQPNAATVLLIGFCSGILGNIAATFLWNTAELKLALGVVALIGVAVIIMALSKKALFE